MKPSNIAKTLTIVAVTALALGIAPRAKADCSEATLKGHHFAYTSTGSIVADAPTSILGPYAEVGVLYFGGKVRGPMNVVRMGKLVGVERPQRRLVDR